MEDFGKSVIRADMINFINTCLLAKADLNGEIRIYYDLKNNRWTNNNLVINRNYQVYQIKIK